MKERGMLFRGEQVRAVLEGRQTQTRRLIKPQPEQPAPGSYFDAYNGGPQWNWWAADHRQHLDQIIQCPYGKPGDRLWVRETWAARPLHDDLPPRDIPKGSKVYYPATPELGLLNCEKQRPSIHMPRWASRITLEITGVRVERLQDISEEDAKAEGAQHFPELPGRSPYGQDGRWSMGQPTSVDQCLSSPRWAFANYFCKIAGKAPKGIHDPRPWDANPWVWVIEFRRIES